MADGATPGQDAWSKWVLENCWGQNPQLVLQKVLQHTKISQGDTVLDVDAGAGLLGFAALPLVGERGKVIFSDISTALLDNCRATAQAIGALDRCEFLHAPAEGHSALPDASVDAVLLKAVLIYVKIKLQAFREFHRVLRPEGGLYVEMARPRCSAGSAAMVEWERDG